MESSSRLSADITVPAKRPKASAKVAAELRHQIVTGRLKPGDRLQPESVLQAEFAISRPTMREALRLLEAESLITISRGKHGGANVCSIDLSTMSRQVGIYLQVQGTTLPDVWFARTIIEPPAAGLLAVKRNPQILAELEANIEQARQAAKVDLIRYADLSAEFSLLITRHCGNQTLHLLAALIFDIIRRQHEHVTERTREKASVDRLRQESLLTRQEAVQMMRRGEVAQVERFWKSHLERMRDLVLAVYDGPQTIDLLNPAPGRPRALSKVMRQAVRAVEEKL
jgi:DNA-binding FadR family transcriptional regulator